MEQNIYHRIWEIASRIPAGKVATYGQIARICGDCTARMVGYAMASLPENSPVPWQRIINAQGKISQRSYGGALQRHLLKEEGIQFEQNGQIDFELYGWNGPDE